MQEMECSVLRVLVADDNPVIRLILKKVLSEIVYVRVIGEAENGVQLIDQVRRLAPDVVFIDVAMPKMDGVKAAEAIFSANSNTFLIFATAHENYMHDAFRVYAFDYFVKPFKIERIRQTMERIQKVKQERDASSCLDELLTHLEDTGHRIAVKSNGRDIYIGTHEIIFITRRGRKTVIVTVATEIETTEPLQRLGDRLKDGNFFRCHKGYIINTTMIKEIMPCGNKTYLVKLINTRETALMTIEKIRELKAMNR